MPSVLVPELASNGSNVPVVDVHDLAETPVVPDPGAQRFRHRYPDGQELDALLVNRGSSSLVVSLHGALNRKLFMIPRFERLRSLLQYRVSSMYFADPSLHIHPGLELSWYTGWEGVDVQRQIAAMIMSAAEGLGVEDIVVTGSSGGGFAALVIASMIPDSTCIAYSPQVDIEQYLADGAYPHAAKRSYLRHVWPEQAKELDIERFDFSTSWAKRVPGRTSAAARFLAPRDTRVLVVSNVQDAHHHTVHLDALKSAIGSDEERLRILPYTGPTGHHPPDRETFDDGLRYASTWTGFELPPA